MNEHLLQRHHRPITDFWYTHFQYKISAMSAILYGVVELTPPLQLKNILSNEINYSLPILSQSVLCSKWKGESTEYIIYTGKRKYTLGQRPCLLIKCLQNRDWKTSDWSLLKNLKMRCCVPLCNNTFDNESTTETKGISFHGFPRNALLRAAWLRALGKQDSQLLDSAVVCSQHFLDDDFCETESGLTQIAAGAVPSTVQVCMICLDTDSKLFPIAKHKLHESYEKLTGHPLSNTGNLKQTICVQCTQRLINSNRFRDKCLRARALMMNLVEKYELITRRHIKMINSTKHKLSSDFVVTTLGPDHYDLYILDPQEDKQTEIDLDGNSVVVKNEENCDTMSVNEDMEVANEIDNGEFVAFNEENLSDNCLMLESKLLDAALYKSLEINRTVADQVAETLDKMKCEIAPLQSTHFSDEFVEHAIQNMHAQNGDGGDDCGTSKTENKQAIQELSECPHTSTDSEKAPVAPLPTRLATNIEAEVQDKEVVAVQKRIQATEINNRDLSNQSAESNSLSNINRLTNCIVKLYDIFKKPKTENVQIQGELFAKTEMDISLFYSQSHIDTTRHTRLWMADIGPVSNKLKVNNTYNLKTSQSETNNCSNNSVNNLLTEKHWFICDVCGNKFKQKNLLVKHIKTHTDIKLFTCKFCKFKSKYELCLNRHNMQTHTSDKPFSCKFCEYRCMQKNALIYHIRTHTGEKPYTCTLCQYKYARKDTLNRHMITHTAEKPFSCKYCGHKCATSSQLKAHTRIHTGEKPYTCTLCEYKYARKDALNRHMRTHTGEKPYSCKFCEYKCAQNGNLKSHTRTHTREKLFACTLCKYKSANRNNILNHIKTHAC